MIQGDQFANTKLEKSGPKEPGCHERGVHHAYSPILVSSLIEMLLPWNEPLAKRKRLFDFSPLFGCDAINFFVPNVLEKYYTQE
ncbi:hypothetical protein [Laspinema olomoucense]|uniref:hypothetical protein n=1 Tax=Laspinema olomoucense TaxID=3231600 RepID=UPI0021BB008F|nr:hypothetical protein [Laspinema sp. D3d]MCT7973418.1 hypothetical protein [Laspinema sp. D3d]